MPTVTSYYKRAIANFYDHRSSNYDEGEWRKRVCDRLLNYSLVGKGQFILDIGTGTGRLAIAAAKIIGNRGSAIGVDLSPKMLTIASKKVKNIGLDNVRFQLADAEKLDYPDARFDRILCANTFPWILDKEAVLKSWHRILKPGGRITIHTPADTAYVGAVVLRQVFAIYGITVEPSNRIGSVERCKKLFISAGFEDLEVKQEQYGSYTSFESAYSWWNNVIKNPSSLSLNVSSEILRLSSAQLADIQSEFKRALMAKQTQEGIWDDLTTLYILGRKADIK